MGLGGISIWQLLIILVIVIMLFGTKRLRNIGSDLGAAVKGFKSSVKNEDDATEEEKANGEVEDNTAELQTEKKTDVDK